MRNRTIIILLFILCFYSCILNAENNSSTYYNVLIEEDDNFPKTAVEISKDTLLVSDTVGLPLQNSTKINKFEFKPNPQKAVLYSLVPGLGQIYNRKYWKLPIVYGGFIGLTYAISWNGGMYNDYLKAYKDISQGTGTGWHDFLPSGVTPSDVNNDPSLKQSYQSSFQRKKDFYRRNRDLAIIFTVALYGLSILDAYVDAQLFDFSISEDLSMRLDPVVIMPNQSKKASWGLQCSINF